MSLAPDVPRHRFTAAEVLRMVEVGILAEDARCELLHGELVAMSPQGPLHRSRAVKIHQLLERAFGDGFHVQDHSPIAAGPEDLPEPDVAVVRGDVDDYVLHHPTGADVPLVVEVAVTSHAIDRMKAGIYATAGVEVYWLLDPTRRVLWEHRAPRDGAYSLVRRLEDTDEVEAGGATLGVAALLPPRT